MPSSYIPAAPGVWAWIIGIYHPTAWHIKHDTELTEQELTITKRTIIGWEIGDDDGPILPLFATPQGTEEYAVIEDHGKFCVLGYSVNADSMGRAKDFVLNCLSARIAGQRQANAEYEAKQRNNTPEQISRAEQLRAKFSTTQSNSKPIH